MSVTGSHGGMCERYAKLAYSRTNRDLEAPQKASRILQRSYFTFGLLLIFGGAAGAEPRHAIAMHGEPAYAAGFHHFPYADPNAPQGGRLTVANVGSFDTLNPFVVRGNAFQDVRRYVIESLMARGADEPFTLYPLIAESVETDSERTYVTFQIDPRARFSDGKPVTTDDVLFSWRLLRDKGRPNHRAYYAKVVRAEKVGERGVRFTFGEERDRELPLILGLMPVLAKHAADAERFEDGGLKPLLGSGPYTVAEVRPGESVTLRRDPSYWGRDLAVNRGHYNFAELRFDFYRDANTHFEAFKRRLYDVRFENDPGRWKSQYDFPAARSGKLVREGFVSGQPAPTLALVFNTRRAPFSDIRVREALGELFDFEWVNVNLYHGAYRRTLGFFEGSELSARGRPANAREQALLAPYPGTVREDVMAGRYEPPVSDGSGRDRARLKHVLELLQQAGYEPERGVIVSRGDRKPLAFEILVATRDDERLALAYAAMLGRAGVGASVRFIDGAQFERRRQNYDFDVMPYVWGQSLSPGNEQAFYFGSAAADQPGTRNYMGVKSPGLDTLIVAIVAVRSREELTAAARALDRVLISGFYVVPLFHLPEQWVARWPVIGRPAVTPLAGPQIETWWRVSERP
jgi:peptide/nickel transport system substrate-binding protein